MFLRIMNHIPLIQCLTYFPIDSHKTAFKKFIVLWILTSLPILFAAALSPIPAGDANVLEKLFTKLSEAISVSEQFVYTASFLTPVLYILFEKYQNSSKEGFRFSQSLKTVFNGYGLVALASLITILLTAAAFSSLKTNPEAFEPSFLNLFLVTYSPYIYIFALYCWYLSLLDGTPVGDFVETNRESENKVSSGLSARLKGRGEN